MKLVSAGSKGFASGVAPADLLLPCFLYISGDPRKLLVDRSSDLSGSVVKQFLLALPAAFSKTGALILILTCRKYITFLNGVCWTVAEMEGGGLPQSSQTPYLHVYFACVFVCPGTY